MASDRSKTVLTSDSEKDVTLSVRRISNGWIISTTVETKNKKGETDFQTTETYSAENPEITVGKVNATELVRAGLVRRRL